jgi:hypothetical protein
MSNQELKEGNRVYIFSLECDGIVCQKIPQQYITVYLIYVCSLGKIVTIPADQLRKL